MAKTAARKPQQSPCLCALTPPVLRLQAQPRNFLHVFLKTSTQVLRYSQPAEASYLLKSPLPFDIRACAPGIRHGFLRQNSDPSWNNWSEDTQTQAQPVWHAPERYTAWALIVRTYQSNHNREASRRVADGERPRQHCSLQQSQRT